MTTSAFSDQQPTAQQPGATEPERNLEKEIEALRLQVQQIDDLKAQLEEMNRRLVALENKSKASRWNKTGSGHFKIT